MSEVNMAERETLLLFQTGVPETVAVKKIAENMRIKVKEVPVSCYTHTIGQIYEESLTFPPSSGLSARFNESMIVFANLTEKHMDKILFELRTRQIKIDYKAVMTPTNRLWDVNRLYFEMKKEASTLL